MLSGFKLCSALIHHPTCTFLLLILKAKRLKTGKELIQSSKNVILHSPTHHNNNNNNNNNQKKNWLHFFWSRFGMSSWTPSSLARHFVWPKTDLDLAKEAVQNSCISSTLILRERNTMKGGGLGWVAIFVSLLGW